AFIAVCHEAEVPVIVDAASEHDWPALVAAGADLVLFSVQKAPGGPTAGVIAGRRTLVRACYAQQRGIGRMMKASKESVVGTIAALRRWKTRDFAAERAVTEERVAAVIERLTGLAGVALSSEPDETGNPFSRVVLRIDPLAAGYGALDLAQALAAGKP